MVNIRSFEKFTLAGARVGALEATFVGGERGMVRGRMSEKERARAQRNHDPSKASGFVSSFRFLAERERDGVKKSANRNKKKLHLRRGF